jgi:hypothetical protein
MTDPPSDPCKFILTAFDEDQFFPALQAQFTVIDLGELRAMLKMPADEDLEHRTYWLEPDELATIITAYDVQFDPSQLSASCVDFALHLFVAVEEIPYLIHTGYELPLLLEGRKKLAKMYGPYPPMTFKGEDRFDHWVAEGTLHREELREPFHEALKPFLLPGNEWEGHRTVYYTPKGEEWRIPAMKLIWQAFNEAGRWNEYFERLVGMLFGYEKWQNDWWIARGLRRGGFGGASVCCAVSAVGLAWLESAGFRALPPCDKVTLAVSTYDDGDGQRCARSCRKKPTASHLCASPSPFGCYANCCRLLRTGSDGLCPATASLS